MAVEEYANWVMITRYLAYIVLPCVIYTYWTTRDISRGHNNSMSALGLSVGMGAVFMPVYILLMLLFALNFEQPIMPLLISAVIVFFDFLNTALNAISSGYAPQFTGYGTFALKLSQAVTGFLLVGFLAMGLTGAVLAALIGRIASDAIMLIKNRNMLRQSQFKPNVIKHWLKSSWLPIILTLSSMIYTFDVLVVRIFYGNEVPIAYYGVVMSLLSAVMFANVVSYSLYPKILSKKSLEDLGEALWLVMLLSVPFATLMILYAKPLIAIFGIQYVPAMGILQLLVIYSTVQVFANLINTTYIGLERVDENGLMSSKGLMKSALFKSGLISLITNSLYLVFLTIISLLNLDVLSTTNLWALSLLIMSASTLFLYITLLKRDFLETLPFKIFILQLGKFLIPAIPASIPVFLLSIELSESFYQMVANMIAPVLSSALLYFGTLLLIDIKFRRTFIEVLKKLQFIR